jgi:hypothetical protein
MTIQGKVIVCFENAQLKLIDPEVDFVSRSWRIYKVKFLKLWFNSKTAEEDMKEAESCASNGTKLQKVWVLIQYCRRLT